MAEPTNKLSSERIEASREGNALPQNAQEYFIRALTARRRASHASDTVEHPRTVSAHTGPSRTCRAEGRLPREHLIEQDAQGPPVDLRPVAVGQTTVQLLGREIGRSAANSVHATMRHGAVASEAEVDELDVAVLVQQKVLRLEVAEDDLSALKMLQSAEDLPEVELGFGHAERLLLAEQAVQISARQVLEQEEEVLAVLRGAQQLHGEGEGLQGLQDLLLVADVPLVVVLDHVVLAHLLDREELLLAGCGPRGEARESNCSHEASPDDSPELEGRQRGAVEARLLDEPRQPRAADHASARPSAAALQTHAVLGGRSASDRAVAETLGGERGRDGRGGRRRRRRRPRPRGRIDRAGRAMRPRRRPAPCAHPSCSARGRRGRQAQLVLGFFG
eukprot:scaffold1623_cov165-Ochromonas_danica.AAC.18